MSLGYRSDLLEFARFDAKLEQRLAEVRAELRQDIAGLRTELHGFRAEMLRWMFGFWVSTVLMLGGLMVASEVRDRHNQES